MSPVFSKVTKRLYLLFTGNKILIPEEPKGQKSRNREPNWPKQDNKIYLSDWTTLNVSEPLEQIPVYMARNEKWEVTDHIIRASKRKIPCCTSHKSPKRRPVKPVSGNFKYPNTFFSKKSEKLLEGEIWRANENCSRRHRLYGPYCR